MALYITTGNHYQEETPTFCSGKTLEKTQYDCLEYPGIRQQLTFPLCFVVFVEPVSEWC